MRSVFSIPKLELNLFTFSEVFNCFHYVDVTSTILKVKQTINYPWQLLVRFSLVCPPMTISTESINSCDFKINCFNIRKFTANFRYQCISIHNYSTSCLLVSQKCQFQFYIYVHLYQKYSCQL